MLAFDTGPGRGGDRRRRAAGRPAALVRSRRPDSRPRDGRTRPCSPSCWPTRSSRRRRPRAPAASASATPTPRRCTRACPAPTASPRRSSSPRGASRRPSRDWTPAGTEVVASGGGCHHPGLMAALERRARGRRRPRAPPVRRPVLPGRRQGSGRVRAAGLSHAARAARQRSRRDRRGRRPRARHGHAGMSTASAALDSGRLILPALRAARRRRLRARGRPHRRRARPRRRRASSSSAARSNRCGG